MIIRFDESQLQNLTRILMQADGVFKRARVSALKSTGNMIRQEVRDFVESGGSGWPRPHLLTQSFKSKQGKSGKAWSRKKIRLPNALYWLGKFARYRVDNEGDLLQVDFGKSRKGQPGTFDPELIGMVKRAAEGENIQVTKKMRGFWAKTKKDKKNPSFALRKSTTELKIPKRPIFDPVWAKIGAKVVPHFEDKFYSAINRYLK